VKISYIITIYRGWLEWRSHGFPTLVYVKLAAVEVLMKKGKTG
jgi:hypothetical protein